MSRLDKALGWVGLRRRSDTAQGYTDRVVAAIVSEASGDAGDSQAVAATEFASSAWGRAFAIAEVSPDSSVTAALTPGILEMTGRQLIRGGEIVLELEVRNGELRLVPCWDWQVRGTSTDPMAWVYRATVLTPDGSRTRTLPANRVVHIRYAAAPKSPWRGVSPLTNAGATTSLAGRLEQRLGQEAGGPVGSLLPVPSAQNTDDLKDDLAALKGKLALVDSLASGWQEGVGAAPGEDWVAKRIGANPPATLPALRTDAAISLALACGIPIGMTRQGDGTAAREAWRQFLHGSVAPVGKLVEAELTRKLDIAVTLGWAELRASDIQGRARAFQSLVAAGKSLEEATALSGLLLPGAA